MPPPPPPSLGGDLGMSGQNFTPPPLLSSTSGNEKFTPRGLLETKDGDSHFFSPKLEIVTSPPPTSRIQEEHVLSDSESYNPSHMAPPDMTPTRVIKEGWLLKKAGPLGISRKRYCVLHSSGILRYYTDESQRDETRKGKGDVSFRTIKETTHEGDVFTVENDVKVWHFKAADLLEAADWLNKFESVKESMQKRHIRYSNSATLEAYGESEREIAERLHTM